MELRNKIIEAILLTAPGLEVNTAERISDRVLSRVIDDPDAYIDLEDDVRTFLFEIEMEKEKEKKQLNTEFENLALDDALAKLKAKTAQKSPTSQESSGNINTEKASEKAKEAAQKHIENLEKLAILKEKGIITEEELQELKKQL